MCAVIGVCLKEPSQSQLETVKRLFLESQIRGKHATGVTLLTESGLKTTVKPVSAKTFLETFDFDEFVNIKEFKIVGHCRYSTSDLRYNQPLHLSETLSIVHNGVITQNPPEQWGEFGYILKTSNDSELLFRSVVAGNEPLDEFPNASIAALELHSSGKMRWYRNGKRPLHYVKCANGFFLCSTSDIAKRAGLESSTKCVPGQVYTS